ncbi:hypothetical protein SCP_0305190 [Sparassis crispa]|uniref:Uncharacterized protein n=1 Tax=Sparassis crispa TaxID=139825 RepID=A0A401GF58_9APHY|nr:hypothetical protein SCP_0305190 [Sparassis crispa]GBE80799.1 hypothetical protein SCP_0305190 [Sparassis crispa]
MGHTHSSIVDAQAQHPPRSIVRKQSKAAFSALTLGCANSPASFSPETYGSITAVTERYRSDEKASFDPPPLYASFTVDILEDSASGAYKLFLKQHPQYQLTWTLDALRRSDFARLDRTGETYVDYMGGSLYPESLLRAQTDFLHRNILGNTHSVSNSYVSLAASRIFS